MDTPLWALALIAVIIYTVLYILRFYYESGDGSSSSMRKSRHSLEKHGFTDEELEQEANKLMTEEAAKKIAVKKQREEAAAQAEFAAMPVQDFTEINIANSSARSFLTDSGDKLVMNAGNIKAYIRMTFRPERTQNDEVDTIQFYFRVADETGTIWECISYLQPNLMTDPLKTDNNTPLSGLVHWKEAPSLWKQAFKQHCLIADGNNLLDSWNEKTFQIGNDAYEVFFCNQTPKIDVAYLKTSSSFIIRISKLYHRILEEDWGDGEGWGERWVNFVKIPPFCFEIPSEDFLFLSSPDYYFSYYKDWYFIHEGKEGRPLIFKQLQEMGIPQSQVRVVKA